MQPLFLNSAFDFNLKEELRKISDSNMDTSDEYQINLLMLSKPLQLAKKSAKQFNEVTDGLVRCMTA